MFIAPKRRPHHYLGEELLSWEAHDYHPHERGKMWHLGFILFMITCMWGIMLIDPVQGWISAICFAIVGVVYLLVHQGDHEQHEIRFHEHGLIVNQRHHFDWNRFEGFWFIEDHYSRQIIFEINEPHKKDRVTLMMGDLHRNHFRQALEMTELKELKGQREGLMALWFRVFKL